MVSLAATFCEMVDVRVTTGGVIVIVKSRVVVDVKFQHAVVVPLRAESIAQLKDERGILVVVGKSVVVGPIALDIVVFKPSSASKTSIRSMNCSSRSRI